MHHCLAICFAFSKAKSPKDCVRVAATELNCTSFERVQNCELVLCRLVQFVSGVVMRLPSTLFVQAALSPPA